MRVLWDAKAVLAFRFILSGPRIREALERIFARQPVAQRIVTIWIICSAAISEREQRRTRRCGPPRSRDGTLASDSPVTRFLRDAANRRIGPFPLMHRARLGR